MNIKPEFLSHRRKPNFRLAAGSCDAHCHVFGPAAKFPYAPNRRYTPADAPREMLAALHAHLGIDRAVIVQASCHGTDNVAMLDCIASDPRRYRGVAIVDDGFTDKDSTLSTEAACAACDLTSSSISAAHPIWHSSIG
jgi:2-pyrone-4,6-dicarboxylate lactonase